MPPTPSSSSSNTASYPPSIHDIIAEELQLFSQENSSQVTSSGRRLCELASQINRGVKECAHHKRALTELANKVSEIVYLVVRTFVESGFSLENQMDRAEWDTQLRTRAKNLHSLLEKIQTFVQGQISRSRLLGILLRDSKRIKRYSQALYQSITPFDFPSPDVIQGCAFLAIIHSSPRGRHAGFPVQDPNDQLSINDFMNTLISQAQKPIQDDDKGLQHPDPTA